MSANATLTKLPYTTNREEIFKRLQCHGYRLPKIEDLKSGAELLMLNEHTVDDVRRGRTGLHAYGTTIKLDRDPFEQGGRVMVYYHCIRSPQWDGQCFTDLSSFVGTEIDFQSLDFFIIKT